MSFLGDLTTTMLETSLSVASPTRFSFLEILFQTFSLAAHDRVPLLHPHPLRGGGFERDLKDKVNPDGAHPLWDVFHRQVRQSPDNVISYLKKLHWGNVTNNLALLWFLTILILGLIGWFEKNVQGWGSKDCAQADGGSEHPVVQQETWLLPQIPSGANQARYVLANNWWKKLLQSMWLESPITFLHCVHEARMKKIVHLPPPSEKQIYIVQVKPFDLSLYRCWR